MKGAAVYRMREWGAQTCTCTQFRIMLFTLMAQPYSCMHTSGVSTMPRVMVSVPSASSSRLRCSNFCPLWLLHCTTVEAEAAISLPLPLATTVRDVRTRQLRRRGRLDVSRLYEPNAVALE